MKKLVLFHCILLCLAANNLYSQKFFREGYIEKKSGEIMTGLVEYSVNQGIPDICTFKRFDIASPVFYTSQMIKAFGYRNGNRYESLELRKKTSFYAVIVVGEIMLYKKGSDFYIDRKKQEIVKIKKTNISYHEAGIEKIFPTLNEFLAYLTEGKAGEIPDNFNLKKDLIQLLISYNKNSRKSYYVIKQTMSERELAEQISFSGSQKNRFGVIAGVNIYKYNIKQNPDVKYGDGLGYIPNPTRQRGFTAGLTYERVLLRKSEKLTARFDMLYTNQTFSCYSETKSSIYLTRDKAFFDFKGIKMPLLLQYSFTGRRIVPFLNAGLAYQLFISGNYLHIEEKQDIHDNVTTSEDDNFKFKPGEISGLGGVGIRARLVNHLNLNLQLRAEYGSGLFVNYSNKLENASYIVKKPYIMNSLQYDLLLGISF